MNTAVNWFEIPAADFDRAVRFYRTLFAQDLTVLDLEDRKMALLPPGAGPEGQQNPAGSLLQTDNFAPSKSGTVVYLNPIENLDTVLSRVEAAGGQVATPKTRIGHGYLATFVDTEGNTVGLLEWDS